MTSRLVTLLALSAFISSSCAMTFDLVGGPRQERLVLEARELERGLGAHVGESPRATRALMGVQSRLRAGTALTWTGLGVLGGCLLVSQVLRGDGGLIAVASSCGVALALEVVALLVLPKLGSYGDVLRAFNQDFPSTPWRSSALDVDAEP